MPSFQKIYEVSGEFWISLSYSIPPKRMLTNRFSRVMLPTLRVFAGYIPIRFEKSCLRSLRYSRGALSATITKTFARKWSVMLSIVGRNGGNIKLLEPANIYRHLCPILLEHTTIRLESPRNGGFIYHYIASGSDGGSIYARRLLNFATREACHDLLFADVYPDRKGVAVSILSAAIPFYVGLGIALIKLEAGLSAGGRTWPKFGFRPVNSYEWLACAPVIRRNLATLDVNTVETWRPVVEALVQNPNPRTIWDVSNLSERITSREGRKLGDLLLNETAWKGVLDLNDSDAFALLNARLRKLR
jgi:hypothetical protein